MKTLASAYLSNKAAWTVVSPRSARENRLLVVQGGPDEVHYYRNMGWDAKALVFSIGLASSFGAEECFGLSPWATTWPVDGMKFDAVVCNQAGNHLLAEPDVFRRITALVAQGGLLHVRLRNPDSYGEVIRRTGREIWPQPVEYPVAMSTTLEEVKTNLPALACTLISANETFDGLYHSADMPHWPSINAWDCSVYLPAGLESRRRLFLESWLLVLTPAAPKQNANSTFDPTDLKGLHKEIEELLEAKKFPEAGLILDKIFQLGQANAETCNLQGVLHFYRQEFRSAWESFRLAILQDGTRLDFYQNLADAGVKADLKQETNNILKLAHGRVAGVEGIIPNA